jgi:hypothetical protein
MQHPNNNRTQGQHWIACANRGTHAQLRDACATVEERRFSAASTAKPTWALAPVVASLFEAFLNLTSRPHKI